MSLSQKLPFALTLLIFCAHFVQGAGNFEERYFFNEHPTDVLAVTPKEHLGLSERWNHMVRAPRAGNWESGRDWEIARDGALTAAAFIKSYYSSEIYSRIAVFVRDPLLIGYAIQLLEPEKRRVEFVNISRLSLKDSHLPDYLREVGLDDKSLELLAHNGQRVLELDSAFKMSIGESLLKDLSLAAQKAVDFQLICSGNNRVPRTNLFGNVSRRSGYLKMHYLAYLPKNNGRSTGYRFDGNHWEPVVIQDGDTDVQGIISPAEVGLMLEDLAYRSKDPVFGATLENIEAVVLQLKQLTKNGDRDAVIRYVKEVLGAAERFGLERHLAVSLIEDWHEANILNPIDRENRLVFDAKKDFGISVRYPLTNDRSIFRAHPDWFKEESEKIIVDYGKFLKRKDFHTIREIVRDFIPEQGFELISALNPYLIANPDDLGARALAGDLASSGRNYAEFVKIPPLPHKLTAPVQVPPPPDSPLPSSSKSGFARCLMQHLQGILFH